MSVYRGNYGGASVLWSLYNRLREDEREVFLIGLGNALEKNASRKALSQMVLFASNPVLDVDHSIDILGSPACSGIDRLWACYGLTLPVARARVGAALEANSYYSHACGRAWVHIRPTQRYPPCQSPNLFMPLGLRQILGLGAVQRGQDSSACSGIDPRCAIMTLITQ